MTVRVFSSSVITLDEGTLDNILNGAFTIAVLFKRSGSTTDGFQALLSFDGSAGGNQRGNVGYTTGSALQLSVSGLSRTFGASFTIANDTWYLFVVRKADGNGVTPTANLYNYTTATWVGWTNGSGTLDDDATALVEVQMGNQPGGFPLNGKIAGAVIYNSVLSNTDAETLETSAQNWFDLGPVAMWRPGETDPVVDDTGNGADQTSITGTSFDSIDVPAWDPTLGGGGDQNLDPSGIASTEAFGTAVITTGPVSITPTGIASAEVFGIPIITTGSVNLSPTGIASTEAFGTPAITTGPVNLAPIGIPSAEAFGIPTITTGAVNVAPTGIASAEAFGTPVLTTGPVTISPTGITSAEAFGTPVVADEAVQVIAPAGIQSAEIFGLLVISAGPVTIGPTGIPSAEAFGIPTVADEAVQVISPTGIPSGEKFGLPVVWIHIVRACDCSLLVDN